MKINIVRQDTLKYRRVQLIRRINALVTFGSIGLFSLAIVYMTSYFVYLNLRQSRLAGEQKQLSATYAGRVKEAADYLAVKEIAAAINDIRAKRFKYREFLSAIYALLPSTAILSSVDFGAPGIIVAGVRLTNLNDYDTLLANIKTASGAPGFLFAAISEKQLARDVSGPYSVTLELKIK